MHGYGQGWPILGTVVGAMDLVIKSEWRFLESWDLMTNQGAEFRRSAPSRRIKFRGFQFSHSNLLVGFD